MMSVPIERSRLESLSDLIFGLALSIGALILIGQAPTNSSDLLRDLSQFGYSFLVLISVWYRYTRTMAVFQVEAAWAMRLNIGLLFLVSIEPFLFNLLFTQTKSSALTAFGNVATSAFALDLAGLLGILAALTLVAQRQAGRRHDAALALRLTFEARLFALGALLFAVSLVPEFYSWMVPGIGLSVRFTLWLVPIVLLPARRLRRSHPGATQKDAAEAAEPSAASATPSSTVGPPGP